MKYGKFLKKFVKWLLILIVLIIVSKAANTYYASYLDKQFERDENGIILGAEPYLIERSNETAVLLLHGLNTNPLVWRELTTYLANRDLTVYVPLIEGHGTSVFDLERTTYEDWIESAEDAYLFLKEDYENVYVGGVSMGGLLTLDLASKYDTKGILVLNAPIYFTSRLVEFVSIVTLVQNYYIKGIFPDKEFYLQEKFKLYKAVPYQEAIEMLEMIEHIKLNINNIEEPILIIQSFEDNIVDPKSSLFILTNVNSEEKEVISLKKSTHMNITSSDQELLKIKIYEFILENE